jgi:hypothetical protein
MNADMRPGCAAGIERISVFPRTKFAVFGLNVWLGLKAFTGGDDWLAGWKRDLLGGEDRNR